MNSKKRKGLKRDKKLFLFVLPVILYVFITSYLPLWCWSFAFVQYKPGRDLLKCNFLGLQNFKDLFGNVVLRRNLVRVLQNTFGMHFLSYLFSPLPVLFAVFLSEVRNKKFQKIVQTVTTLPNFISWVIMFSLARSILGADGVMNTLFQNLGMDVTINVLNSGEHVWLTQVLISTWKGLGWSAIVYFAAIAGLDQELYEAAMVDGAKKMQRIWYITLPNLIPTYFTLLIMSIGNFLNTGVEQYMVFGNALNKDYIETLDLYVYNIGIGSAGFAGVITLASIIAVAGVVIAYLTLRY